MAQGSVKYVVQRCRAACFANLSLKLLALVIAVILHVLLVHRGRQQAAGEERPPACAP
jgi:hypothetical protein